MTISYFVGQKRNAINYDMKTIFKFTVLFLALYGTSLILPDWGSITKMLCNTVLLFIFLLFAYRTIKQDRRIKSEKL
jgi:hypothetical protein